MNEQTLLNNQGNHKMGGPEADVVSDLAERLDFLDIQILRKFYTTGREFPFDTQPYCFPLLYKEMKTSHRIKMGMEALRKRLTNLTGLGLLVKIKSSNPTNYAPRKEMGGVVKATIVRFFVIQGLTKNL